MSIVDVYVYIERHRNDVRDGMVKLIFVDNLYDNLSYKLLS